jgi:HTH-type transcriptional regulator/antitoxin HigA
LYGSIFNKFYLIHFSFALSYVFSSISQTRFPFDKYEQEKYPIDFPDPIDTVKFRKEQLGCQQKDLVSVMGLKSRVSEILNRKRKLTLEMIRKLSAELSIPTDILVKEY